MYYIMTLRRSMNRTRCIATPEPAPNPHHVDQFMSCIFAVALYGMILVCKI